MVLITTVAMVAYIACCGCPEAAQHRIQPQIEVRNGIAQQG